MEHQEVISKSRNFICQRISETELDPGLDIFECGYVYSLFAMELVLFVEKEFGVVIENEDLDLANFKSLNAISQFVGKKLTPA